MSPSNPPVAACTPLQAETETAIERALATAGVPGGCFTIDLRDECASTNSTLLELAEGGAPSGTVVVTQHQSAGRGRRGRQWISAPGDSLTFSLLWRFAPGTAPSGLSLAVGLALVRALATLSSQASPPAGAAQGAPIQAGFSSAIGAGEMAVTGAALSLKWPNDVLLDGRKLAGVLVELLPGASHAAVIGIGLNRRLPAELPRPLRDVSAAWPGDTSAPDLLAAILVQLEQVLAQFGSAGFPALRDAWQRHHAHQDRMVTLSDELTGERHGICRGVAPDGALLLETSNGLERVLSGDVSLRLANP